MMPLEQVESAPAASIPPLKNSQNSNKVTSRGQVVYHFAPTWFTQNVYPMVTPKRIFCFFLSQTCFFLAYAFFTLTEFYQSYIKGCDHDHDHDDVFHQARPLLFLVAAFGTHTLCLIFLLFFSFLFAALEKCKYHYLMKSVGEFLVKLLVVVLVVRMGKDRHAVGATQGHSKVKHSQVAGLATWCLLTVDAFGIVSLLEPLNHYTLLEATVTLTLHLGMDTENYFPIAATIFVFVIVVMKNYLQRHTHHPQPPADEPRPVAWVPPEIV